MKARDLLPRQARDGTQRTLREEETKRKAFFAQDTIGMAVEFKYRYTDGT